MTNSDAFTTPRKIGLDTISHSATPLTPAKAYESYIEWEEASGLPAAELYSSTAITSGGYVRNPAYTDRVAHRRDIISANNRIGALLVGQLTKDNAYVHEENVLLTTELGPVKGWEDSHFMQFWLYNLSSILPDAAKAIDERFSDPDYQPLLRVMNDFSRPNIARWPAYKRFTEQLLESINAVPESQLVRRPIPNILQLVDVQLSLGCRAETLAARSRDMPLLAPEVKTDMLDPASELTSRIHELTQWEAEIGLPPAAARLSVVSLS